MRGLSRTVGGIFLIAVLLLLGARPSGALPPLPCPAPAVITVPDCSDGFTMDVRARRNPETLGTVTRDGYPVLLDREGANRFILPRGEKIHTPMSRNGYPLPDYVPNAAR